MIRMKLSLWWTCILPRLVIFARLDLFSRSDTLARITQRTHREPGLRHRPSYSRGVCLTRNMTLLLKICLFASSKHVQTSPEIFTQVTREVCLDNYIKSWMFLSWSVNSELWLSSDHPFIDWFHSFMNSFNTRHRFVELFCWRSNTIWPIESDTTRVLSFQWEWYFEWRKMGWVEFWLTSTPDFCEFFN